MSAEHMIGFVQYSTSGEATRAVHAAIQAVLDGSLPTEEKVRAAMWQNGCKDIMLTLSPHAGAGGEIYGGKQVQFRFRATWNGHGISGGTLCS